MIKTAIFDVDGTLLNSTEMWKTLGERYVLSLGKTPASDLSERLRELSLDSAAKLLKMEYGLSFSEREIVSQTIGLTENFYRAEVTAKIGAEALLKRLCERGITLKILTSGNAKLAKAALERLNLLGFFDEIIGNADKSTAADFLKICENPHEALVFEDALYAVKSAKSAGFITCAVCDFSEKNAEILWKTADFYENNLADYAEKIDEILKIVENRIF